MLGPDTTIVNGQRVALPSWYAFSPVGYLPQSQGVPIASVTAPPVVGQGSAIPATGTATVGGYSSSANQTAAAVAQADPFSLTKSPVIWIVVVGIVAMILLDKLFWRKV